MYFLKDVAEFKQNKNNTNNNLLKNGLVATGVLGGSGVGSYLGQKVGLTAYNKKYFGYKKYRKLMDKYEMWSHVKSGADDKRLLEEYRKQGYKITTDFENELKRRRKSLSDRYTRRLKKLALKHADNISKSRIAGGIGGALLGGAVTYGSYKLIKNLLNKKRRNK